MDLCDRPRITFGALGTAVGAAVIARDGEVTEVDPAFIEIGDSGTKRGAMVTDLNGAAIEVGAASIEVGGFLDTFDAAGTTRGDFYIAGE